MDQRASPRAEVIDRARAALCAGDAAAARRLFDAVYAEHPDDPDVRECLARCACLELDFVAASEHWQGAYAGFRANDDQLGGRIMAKATAGTVPSA
jgi:hypothetical protein